MTIGNLVRVQEKGQVTLPTEIRNKLGLKKGDLVSVSQTAKGVLITPQAIVAKQALDEIGKALKEKGVTLDELMKSGEDIRETLVKERYDFSTEAKK